MKTFLVSLLSVSALLLFTALTPASRADEWNKSTSITFDNPMEIPGQVLPAGTYVFKTLDNTVAQNIVQVWNGDQTQLVATLHVVPEYVHEPYDTVVFNSDHSGSVARLDSWFYPGDNNGFQFNYGMSPTPR
jgi:hypothetical protein